MAQTIEVPDVAEVVVACIECGAHITVDLLSRELPDGFDCPECDDPILLVHEAGRDGE